MSADTAKVERAEELLPRANWKWFALRGALALMLGVVAILFPASALLAFTMVFAAFAVADGLASLLSGLRGAKRKEERWWTLILRGLVGIAVGVIFALMPLMTTISYAIVSLALLAVWSIATGVLEISAAVTLRKEIKGEWLLGLSGVLSILLGLAIPFVLALYPAPTILSVAWIIGIYAVAAGIVLIVQAFRLRASTRGGAGDTPKSDSGRSAPAATAMAS